MPARDPARSKRVEAAGDELAQAGDHERRPAGLIHFCEGCGRAHAGRRVNVMCGACLRMVAAFERVMCAFQFPCHEENSAEFWVTYYELRAAAGLPLFEELDVVRDLLFVISGGRAPADSLRRPGCLIGRTRKRPA